MTESLHLSFVAGVERLTAWADLLDRINVFPIADGDTGRNLVVSLSPLRSRDRLIMPRNLLLAAKGNSGNIAARFFHYLVQAGDIADIPGLICRGRDNAWSAVSDPQPGTMLTFFDALATVSQNPDFIAVPEGLIAALSQLENVVAQTVNLQPRLSKAQVVDAGALGMFLFFEGFFHALADGRLPLRPITETFRERLQVSASYADDGPEQGYCVDTLILGTSDDGEGERVLASLGESIVITRSDVYTKVHFHTGNRQEARRRLAGMGEIIEWSEDDLYAQTSGFGVTQRDPLVHIMTDAAGSLTRPEAQALGITLLDSYIMIGDRCLPETYLAPDDLYAAMRRKVRVTTAQASVFERHQIYESILSRYRRVLYLCVGSAFTGNYRTALDWKQKNDPHDRFAVLDTGAASGRLGLIALSVAEAAHAAPDVERIMTYAQRAVEICRECVFLDRLEYLAAGGRLSKTGAFFGDMLRMKPVVSPMPEGVRKMGVVRNREEQLHFALKSLKNSVNPDEKSIIMLQYSDNRTWVEKIGSDLAGIYPHARILIYRMSLTSGAHMGPGTWAVAFMPTIDPSS